MLSRPLGSAQQARLVRAGPWAAVCGPDGVWPCGGVWPSEMRVEGRRRPKMAVVAHLYVACGHGWSILNSICNLPLVFLRILSSAQFFSERLHEVPSFLETCRLVRWDLPRENSVRAEICSPRPEIFCCKLTRSLISPRDFLGSAPVFLRSCAFCRALFEMSRLALCSLLNSPRPVLKIAPLRFHEGLVSP